MIYKFFLPALVICLLPVHSFCQPEAPSVTKMGNGLTVILVEDHVTELAAVDVWVRAGSGNETPEISGVSHFIEHLVFSATKKRQPGDMDREMESLGATLDAHTSRDWAHFNTTVSSRYLDKALEILADAIANSQFRTVDVQREGPIILDEIAKKRTDQVKVCRDYLAAELYPEHPYGLPVEGTPESVRKITRENILDYYRKHYVAGNMAVVIVGDIEKQEAVAAVGRAFQSLPSSPAPDTPRRAISPPTAQVVKSLKEPFNLNYVSIGFLGPQGSDYSDVCATDVLLTYVGFGYRSWLTEELRSKMGLAVTVDADFLTQREPGMISIIAGTTDASTDKAKGALFARLASLRIEGLSETELAAAKRSLLGQYAFQNESFGGRANSAGFYFTVSDPMFAIKYIDNVQSVTNEDVIRVAQKYLDPGRAVVLTIGPEQGGAK